MKTNTTIFQMRPSATAMASGSSTWVRAICSPVTVMGSVSTWQMAKASRLQSRLNNTADSSTPEKSTPGGSPAEAFAKAGEILSAFAFRNGTAVVSLAACNGSNVRSRHGCLYTNRLSALRSLHPENVVEAVPSTSFVGVRRGEHLLHGHR